MGHLPTPVEPLPNLGARLGLELYAKRDDCTGTAFGGNKVRQLEFYLGAAQAQGATVVLITGAVQSNFVRTAAAMAAKLGMGCHIQLEDRVPIASRPTPTMAMSCSTAYWALQSTAIPTAKTTPVPMQISDGSQMNCAKMAIFPTHSFGCRSSTDRGAWLHRCRARTGDPVGEISCI